MARIVRAPKAIRAVPVTISLPETMLAELDRVVRATPFGSRSDAVQAALLPFLSERAPHRPRGGTELAVLAVCFDRRDERRVAEVKHAYGDVIRSMMHTHLEHDDCVEIFVANGSADRVAQLHAALSGLRGVHLVRRAQLPAHEGLV
jgi:CopG family transcriptional regulator, nickel-responsive regulator